MLNAFFPSYSICLRKEEGFCCVQYEVCRDQLTALPGEDNTLKIALFIRFYANLAGRRTASRILLRHHGCKRKGNSLNLLYFALHFGPKQI